MKYSDERLGSVQSNTYTIAHINDQVVAAKLEAFNTLSMQFLEALELLNAMPSLALWLSQSLIAFNCSAATTIQAAREMKAAQKPEIIIASELPPMERKPN
jgi:hypothetical protein